MKTKPDLNEAIHNRHPWAPYLQKLITSETLLTETDRRRESLNGKWHYTQDPNNTCLRAGWAP